MSGWVEISMTPIYLVDIAGASLMILFSSLCVDITRGLRRRDPENLLWSYLLWLSLGLLVFSVSRSGSHLIKYLLLALDLNGVWVEIRPITGSINSLSFVLVGAITLFLARPTPRASGWLTT
ncbi:MAG: hypothetical protein ACUVXD_19235 [Thermodesulfobacteriota bacterium]